MRMLALIISDVFHSSIFTSTAGGSPKTIYKNPPLSASPSSFSMLVCLQKRLPWPRSIHALSSHQLGAYQTSHPDSLKVADYVSHDSSQYANYSTFIYLAFNPSLLDTLPSIKTSRVASGKSPQSQPSINRTGSFAASGPPYQEKPRNLDGKHTVETLGSSMLFPPFGRSPLMGLLIHCVYLRFIVTAEPCQNQEFGELSNHGWMVLANIFFLGSFMCAKQQHGRSERRPVHWVHLSGWQFVHNMTQKSK